MGDRWRFWDPARLGDPTGWVVVGVV